MGEAILVLRWGPPGEFTVINISWGQEFSGGPAVRTQCSYHRGSGWTSGWGTKTPQLHSIAKTEKKTSRQMKTKRNNKNKTNQTKAKKNKENKKKQTEKTNNKTTKSKENKKQTKMKRENRKSQKQNKQNETKIYIKYF